MKMAPIRYMLMTLSSNNEACEEAVDSLSSAIEAAAITCGAALFEPTPFGEAACLYFTGKIIYYEIQVLKHCY